MKNTSTQPILSKQKDESGNKEEAEKEPTMAALWAPPVYDSAQPSIETTTSTKHRFSTHVVWTLAARCLAVLSSAAMGIILARGLGPQGVGELIAINVIIIVAVQLSSLGLPSANTCFVARDGRRVGSVLANSLVFALVAGVVLALSVVLLSIMVPGIFGSIIPKLITVAAVAMPFQLMILMGLNIVLGLGRVGTFNLLDAGGQFLAFVNSFLAVVILRKGLLTLITLNSVTAVLLSIIIVWVIHRASREFEFDQAVRLDAELFRQMATYGLKFHVSLVAALLIFRADLLIVHNFRGSAEAGVYAVAAQVGNLLMLLPMVIGTLLMPRVASRIDDAVEFTMRATRHTVFLMLIICISAIPAAFLLPILYGPAFEGSIELLLILVPGIFLVSVESVLVQYFGGTELPLAIPLFWSICLVVNVVINLAFVPIYGARAAAFSSTISYGLILVMVAALFRFRTGSTLAQMLLLRGHEFRKLLTLTQPKFLRR